MSAQVEPAPLQPAVHAMSCDPVSVTGVPDGNPALHVGGQSMPGVELVTRPPPSETVSVGVPVSGARLRNVVVTSTSPGTTNSHVVEARP
jgi:hypothetical protein